MKSIQPYPVAVALSFLFVFLFVICIAVHYLLPGTGWAMYHIWEMVLPGFTWLTPMSFLLGILEMFIGAFCVAYAFIPIYNFYSMSFNQNGGLVMKPLSFKPLALALSTFGGITYALCIVFDIIFPQWAMYRLWEILLPGFTWISWWSFFIGLLGVIAYGVYIAAVFVPIYNFFRGNDLPEMK